ncbi:unnamed protein product [Darwinula stevensoni]|uniref:non-specific serine/threonine protein kinase n=1 Tax=Darwinula stevensoni TaxID=69355 RepID=A0A7R9A920_9CRUS|nr:unnamed protein product [Darwinula stevensoni]CAG0896982.1 unnamed protein product [Darwinula stevensoni]
MRLEFLRLNATSIVQPMDQGAIKNLKTLKKNPRYQDKSLLRVIREVHTLSSLSHLSIVSYKNAWIERLGPSELYQYFSAQQRRTWKRNGSNAKRQIYPSEVMSVCGGTERSGAVALPHSEDGEISLNGCSVEQLKGKFWENGYSSSMSPSSTGSKTTGSNSSCSIEGATASFQHPSENQVACFIQDTRPSALSRVLDTYAILYLQMELCGETLRDYIDKHNGQMKPIDAAFNLDCFYEILLGISHIHQRDIVHRDLKPQNIFFNREDGRIQIGDFGLARLIGPTGEVCAPIPLPHSTQVGTISYAAPEQLLAGACTTKSDMYSIGVILFELFCSFSTGMERGKCFDDLRIGRLPHTFQESWPIQKAKEMGICTIGRKYGIEESRIRKRMEVKAKLSRVLKDLMVFRWEKGIISGNQEGSGRIRERAALVKQLTHRDPEKRPSASDVLATFPWKKILHLPIASLSPSQGFQTHTMEKECMREECLQIRQENTLLKQRIRALEEVISTIRNPPASQAQL